MKSMHPWFLSAALFTSVGCDPGDEEQAIELFDGEVAEQPEHLDIDQVDDSAVEAPDPLATYWDCPDSSSFCFWFQPGYGGKPIAFPPGDFAIKDFGKDVWSMLKRKGTYRVKLFSEPNYKGNCKVFGLSGDSAQSPNLGKVRSARRMEPSEGPCS